MNSPAVSLNLMRQEVLPAVRKYSQLSPWRSVRAIIFDWLVIFACAWVATRFRSVFLSALAIVIIAGRQHGLFILMHEAAHHRLVNRRGLNDWMGNYLITFPILFKMQAYRKHHLQHHRYTNSESDPDWIRKKDSLDWQFPKTNRALGKLSLKYFFGFGLLEMSAIVRLLSGFEKGALTNQRGEIVERITYYGTVALLVTVFGAWKIFLTYWMLPLVWVLPGIMRLRSIAEHFALKKEHELNGSRNIHCAWYERLLFAPHQINLHADHHLYPSIPFYHLPRFNKALRENAIYRAHVYENSSYLGFGRTSLLSDLKWGPR